MSIRFKFIAMSCIVLVPQMICRADPDPVVDPSGLSKSITADPKINERLSALIKRHQVPGMVAGLIQGTELIAVGAAGVRKSSLPEPITVNDKMHLGSCTKAMTATRVAMLVETGKLQWGSTLASVFPEECKDVHPDLWLVTLEQLLTHRAGLPANVAWEKLGTTLSTTEQRLTLLRTALKSAPMKKPGTEFLYSNVGYALAGAMIERVTDQSWEQLMEEGLFKPLGMRSAGFGAPGTAGGIDQPWGHISLGGILIPMQQDNPPALGPAGIVHASISDWAKFAVLHLQQGRGGATMLRPENFNRLQTPPEQASYAMGWIVVEPDWAKCRVLAHDGSNTMWYAMIWLLPERNLAVLVAANRAGDSAQTACHEAVRSLLDDFETIAPISNAKH